MRDKTPQPLEIPIPASFGPAVHDNGMQPGIAGQDFPAVAGGRVARDDAGDVFFEMAEHGLRGEKIRVDALILRVNLLGKKRRRPPILLDQQALASGFIQADPRRYRDIKALY